MYFHVNILCDKASRKLTALNGVCRYFDFEKRRNSFKAFFESQFSYAPLIWMFCDRSANSRINRLHERALKMVYKDIDLDFDQLLFIDGNCTVHHKNIKQLLIEIFKHKNRLSPEIVNEMFTFPDLPNRPHRMVGNYTNATGKI